MRRIFILAIASAMLALLCLPGIAHAGPQVIASDPEQGAAIHEPPAEATITFDLVLDPDASEFVILDECGNRVDGDDLRIEANKMTISIAKTPAGYYDMVYNASAPAGVTGSTEGRITFLVHGGKTCGPGAAGHSGHDGHGGDGGDGEPGDGEDHSGHGDPGAEHDGHDDGSSSHEGDHSTTHAGAGTHDSMDHSTESMSGASHEHNSNKHRQNGAAGNKEKNPTASPPIAAPEVLAFNLTHVPGGSLLLALLLCLALGVGGGYLIRQKGVL